MKITRATLEAIGFEVVPDRCTDTEIAFMCPQPDCRDRSGNRSVNARTGKTSCWRCGIGGDFVKWAKRLGYEVEDDELANTSLPQAMENLDKLWEANLRTPAYVTEVKLPGGFTLLDEEPDCYHATRIARMARKKHLELEDFIEAGVGFCRDSQRWEPYAIFPVVEWDRNVYWQGRTYIDVPGESTKRFPSRNEVPFGSRHWVYNIDEARRTPGCRVIIVESILNVLSLRKELRARGIPGVVPVAIFKHALSVEQAKKLGSIHGVKEFCLLFDSDAISAAWKTIEKSALLPLSKFSLVEMPSGVDANDDAKVAVSRWKRRALASGSEGMLNALSSAIQGI